MLVGSHFAGIAIEQSMLGAAHACANPLTARYGLAHGLALADPAAARRALERARSPAIGYAAARRMRAERARRRLERFAQAGGLGGRAARRTACTKTTLPELARSPRSSGRARSTRGRSMPPGRWRSIGRRSDLAGRLGRVFSARSHGVREAARESTRCGGRAGSVGGRDRAARGGVARAARSQARHDPTGACIGATPPFTTSAHGRRPGQRGFALHPCPAHRELRGQAAAP